MLMEETPELSIKELYRNLPKIAISLTASMPGLQGVSPTCFLPRWQSAFGMDCYTAMTADAFVLELPKGLKKNSR